MRAQRGMRLSCLKRISASGSVLSFFHTTTCFITCHRVLGIRVRVRARANPNPNRLGCAARRAAREI